MNSTDFEKWLAKKVLPNLPEASVIVLNNAPYQCKQLQSTEVISWLQRR
jgi:hypothetical protein